MLVSCNKEDGADLAASDVGLLSSLAVYNGVIGTSNIEVFLDNDKLNSATQRVGLGGMLPHINVIPGKRTLSSIFQFQRESTEHPAPSQREAILSQSREITLVGGKYYSLFLYGNGEATMDYRLVEDNLIKPRPGSFKIRLANFRMHNDLPRVEFLINGGLVNSAYGASFGEVTIFAEYPTAALYTININGLGKGYENFSVSFTPKEQAVYTVWVWGSANAAPQLDEEGNIRPPMTITEHGAW